MAHTDTRVRYGVVAFLVGLAGVTYLDRVCISILKPAIAADFHLTEIQMGYVFSAFALAYAIFEIPTAWWADRIGSRSVLTRIVLWWSAFTMLTGATFNLGTMLVVRFLFGAGEAGAWPNAGRVFSRWIPAKERGRVQGVFFAGAHLAGGLTPAVVTLIAMYVHWRVIFFLFGFIGVAWALGWYRWFRDEPHDHKSVGPGERELIERERGLPPEHKHGGFGEVFRIPSMLPLCIQYFANSYGSYFFMTWLPTYLAKARGMKAGELALFAGLPLLLSTVADVTGGMTTDGLSRRIGVRKARGAIGFGAYVVACGVLAFGAVAQNAMVAGTMIAVAGALSMFTLAPSWATAIDLGGRNSAVSCAVMNTSGQVGAILSPLVVAYIIDRIGNWTVPLFVLAGLYGVAALSWLVINPVRRERAAEV